MKIAIIGGGACGLLAGNILSMNHIDYDLYEKKKLGTKLLASGNGRCNISNINVSLDNYLNNQFAYNLVKENQNELFNLFKKLHIYTYHDNEGRLYPLSESSKSIFNILYKNIKNVLYYECNNIKKIDNKYHINNKIYDKVIICIGSNIQVLDYSYNLLDNLNMKYKKFSPSLVGFKVKEDIHKLSGVRQKATVTLVNNDKIIHSEYGEVMFKDDGVSGICIMNLSSYYNHLNSKNNSKVIIDFLNDNKFIELDSVLKPDLLDYINKYNLNPNKFILNIVDSYDFKFAQVGVGGVDILSLNSDLSSKIDKNIYFGGEVIDVDGVCGGYNLMFAFTSSLVITRSIINEVSNK